MIKYYEEYYKIDVLNYCSRVTENVTVSRQVIFALQGCGISCDFFLDLMDEDYKEMEEQLKSKNQTFRDTVLPDDHFLMYSQHLLNYKTKLHSMICKENIKVKVPYSCNLIGFADDTGVLKEGVY
jgi:hypothetical protein